MTARPGRTTGRCGCREAESFHVLVAVIEGSIEVRGHPEISFAVAACPAWPGGAFDFLHLGQRLSLVGDDDFFARLESAEEFRQRFLGFFQGDAGHDLSLFSSLFTFYSNANVEIRTHHTL